MSYYGSTDYLVSDDFVLRMKDIRKGNLDLAWLDAGTEQIEVNASSEKRGLTYLDLNRGSYGYDEVMDAYVAGLQRRASTGVMYMRSCSHFFLISAGKFSRINARTSCRKAFNSDPKSRYIISTPARLY